MGYLEDFYNKYRNSKSNSEYNANVEGGDTFNIAGYDPTDGGGTGYFADIRATGTGSASTAAGFVYRNNAGEFFLRIRATG